MISLKNIKKFIFQIEIIPVSDFQLHLASFLSGKDCSDKNVVENVHHGGRATTEKTSINFILIMLILLCKEMKIKKNSNNNNNNSNNKKNKKEISKCILRSDKKIMLSATSG